MKLVDTSAWVEFLRRAGDPQAKRVVAGLLEDGLAAYTCPIRFELLSGVRPEEEDDLQQALGFSHHILFEADDWREAASLERLLRKRGVRIPRNDLFVATVAIRTALPLLCRDAHFNAIAKALCKQLTVDQI
jgi:predicted nucleic acid-binding protein